MEFTGFWVEAAAGGPGPLKSGLDQGCAGSTTDQRQTWRPSRSGDQRLVSRDETVGTGSRVAPPQVWAMAVVPRGARKGLKTAIRASSCSSGWCLSPGGLDSGRSAARRDRLSSYKHSPGDEPANRQGRRRKAATVSLAGRVARSRVHVILDGWTFAVIEMTASLNAKPWLGTSRSA